MKQLFLICIGLMIATSAMAQKKVLDHEDFAIWNRITSVSVSDDGHWVTWRTVPGEGDAKLHLFHVQSEKSIAFPRVSSSWLTSDENYLIYRCTAATDTLKAMRRNNIKKADLPGDSLVIYDLRLGTSRTIPHLKSVRVPAKWSGAIAYQVEPQDEVRDTTGGDEESQPAKSNKKAKKYSKKNGYPLIVLDLEDQSEDTLDFVTDYTIAEEHHTIAALSTGRDSTLRAGVYAHTAHTATAWSPIKQHAGEYSKLKISNDGKHIAFYGDLDTTKSVLRPHEIYMWSADTDSARLAVGLSDAFIPSEWVISQHHTLQFSDSGDRLYFGLAPVPVQEDTTLLDEEKVSVEVWHYQDQRLYTQQSVRAEDERKRSYLAVLELDSGRKTCIADESHPGVRLDRERKAPFVVLTNDAPYLREMSWTGMSKRDVYLHEIASGKRQRIASQIGTTPTISPGFRYLTWYSRVDSTWMISGVGGKRLMDTRSIPQQMYNELHDSPSYPGPYGSAGWTKDDQRFLVYDRYDIWSVSPEGRAPALNLTNGRSKSLRYRYIRTDPEEMFIDPAKPVLLSVFNEITKASGYAYLDLMSGNLREVRMENARLTTRPTKAKNAEVFVFTSETFEQFPDLRITVDQFQTDKVISKANPQQSEYKWGKAELFDWTASDGTPHRGLLIKPADFNPNFKYPMIVNFYERSSDGLYNHRAPAPHRSTINYSFYASRGYVIFNPDVHYNIGQPGLSAYNSVISGTQAVIDKGFVDPQRVGVQGHSWGGYQIADLITRTDLFACAESGAPVVNMVSAYGGIRWQTGLSRMFQYEKTQSRLGATLWEDPDLYLDNSPIFNLDKVNTPVLIMHNDHDGHVPWYQGIEFFVAMRRLGKPAWMLNYNNEPHWPLKLQNRKDFNIRMQQFFDHFLLGAPMPKWMRDGVPAVNKGILQGYELLEDR